MPPALPPCPPHPQNPADLTFEQLELVAEALVGPRGRVLHLHILQRQLSVHALADHHIRRHRLQVEENNELSGKLEHPLHGLRRQLSIRALADHHACRHRLQVEDN